MQRSRPSGCRLSWCRPWKRGAVGFFSSGYCSVTTFLNIVEKVTPKPFTPSSAPGACSGRPATPGVGVSGMVVLLLGKADGRAGGGHALGHRGRGGALVEGRLAGHRRHGEAARERGPR